MTTHLRDATLADETLQVNPRSNGAYVINKEDLAEAQAYHSGKRQT